MKYSELTSYLELARWENESDDYHIKVYRNGYTVAEVGLWEQYNVRVLDPTQMTEGLYRRLTDLAKTPLAERQEEKKYNVIFPTIQRDGNFIYMAKDNSNGDPLGIDWSSSNYMKGNPKLYTFTEQEIKDIDERYLAFKVEVTP